MTAIAVCTTLAYQRVSWLHYSVTFDPRSCSSACRSASSSASGATRPTTASGKGESCWGALVNTCRSLTRQIITLIEPQPDAAPTTKEAIEAYEAKVVHTLIGYVHALRHHLRDTDPFPTIARVIGDDAIRIAT